MKNLILVLVLFVAAPSFAQTADWQLYKTVDGVNVYTKVMDCDEPSIPGQKAYILKVENTTSKDIKVEWDASYWYNGVKVNEGIAQDENHHVVLVKSMSSVQGECSVPRDALYVFIDFTVFDSETKLTKFELENITVSRQ